MSEMAKFMTALAALLGAIAWPTAFLIAIFAFRKPIVEIVARLRKGKVGIVEVELDRIARQSTSSTAAGEVTIEQVRSAARIEANSELLGRTEVFSQLDQLCNEYDSLRRAMPSGERRTRAMTEILVKMRALGPSVMDRLHVYMSSGSAGSRLAAIAAIQMDPKSQYIDWIEKRFSEEQPFLLYHAALALSNMANVTSGQESDRVIRVARSAKRVVQQFSGTPDTQTISVLDSIISSHSSG